MSGGAFMYTHLQNDIACALLIAEFVVWTAVSFSISLLSPKKRRISHAPP